MVNVLKAKKRTSTKRSYLRSLREQGGIPAVVYGYQTDNTPISIDNTEFIKLMRDVGRNGVIQLDLEGKKINAILHEYQEDPIKSDVIHADFLSVDLSQEIEATVRIELTGEAVGVKNGGVAQQILHEVTVTAKPDDLPEVIAVDISGLDIADSISIGEIRGNYSITINHEDDETIATILTPTVEQESEDGEDVSAPEEAEENKDTEEE
ncbi:50S ribosomal protein L25/general stress protein Ctc [Siminovitchia sediminis]|uniref:Large ribosomal subunit protein bL25 n=1 Tax=Siminovitchia sediminis TaxID=1274353 RepID=A0ABW4KH98_9BACI